jgi:hypothetical protein
MSSIERTNLLAHARSIVEKAKAQDRDLTPTEATNIWADLDRVDELKAREGSALHKRVMALGPDVDQFDPDRPGMFDEQAKAGLTAAIKSRSTFRTEVDTKAALTGAFLPTSGFGVEGGLFPNAYPIATLFRTEQAGGPSVR